MHSFIFCILFHIFLMFLKKFILCIIYINFKKSYIPSIVIFSAMVSAEIFSVLLYFFHFSFSQISRRVPTPIIITSLIISAYALNVLTSKNLPCLSISHSVAPDRKNLTKSLAFLLVSGSSFNLLSKLDHSFWENTNKHPSNPYVIMNFSPISVRNFAGIINLPFPSSECSYSPINTWPHLTIFLPHFVPLSTT